VIEFLADPTNNFGDTRGGSLAGPMGLLILSVLAIVTIFLIRNMGKRIKRLPDSFDKQENGSVSSDAMPPSGRNGS
jgi:hypothetical protein